MFSRDAKHYRQTPRSLQQAFGPNTDVKDLIANDKPDLIDMICAAAGIAGTVVFVVLIGVAFAVALAA
jgi:hypothetical protein